jgi:acetyl-CoA acyltransferase
VLPKPARGFPAGDVTAVSTTLGWRLVNERMPKEWTVSLGEANEQLAEALAIPRQRQDEFAAESHRRAAEAWREGFYDDLVVPVPGAELARDESIRRWPGSPVVARPPWSRSGSGSRRSRPPTRRWREPGSAGPTSPRSS